MKSDEFKLIIEALRIQGETINTIGRIDDKLHEAIKLLKVMIDNHTERIEKLEEKNATKVPRKLPFGL